MESHQAPTAWLTCGDTKLRDPGVHEGQEAGDFKVWTLCPKAYILSHPPAASPSIITVNRDYRDTFPG